MLTYLSFYNFKSKAFYLSLILAFISNACLAQKPTSEERKFYKKAKKYLINEDFKSAQDNYLKLIELNPTDEIYNFEGALSYYFADFERAKSIPLFEAALANSKEDTIPELYYYLARAYHIDGQFEKSKEAFVKFKPFIKTNSNAGQELMKQSEYYIKINENGNKYLATKDDTKEITNLGKSINSSFGEYAPVLKDENIILFTSRRETPDNKKKDKDLLPYENVFVAKKLNDDWELITDKKELEKYIPENLNTKKHDAGIIYSSDGKTLYTYKNDVIWKSILEDGKWSKLVELDKNINSSQYNIPSVSLSKDGNTIFFVSYRKNGLGGKDIYKSIKSSEGNWGEAENLGEMINTKFDEESPYISEDGNTLYFSSKGHDGIGGYDIYKSNFENGNWTNPVNLGLPINSSADDIYLIIDTDEKIGFFASARDGGLGGMDIYMVSDVKPSKVVNTINGLLVNEQENPINDGTLSIKNISTDNTLGSFKTSEGKFNMSTESIGKHEIIVEAPGFEKQISYLDLPNQSTKSDMKIMLAQFDKNDETYQILSIASNELGINTSDTIKLEKLVVSNNNNSNNSNSNTSNNIFASYTDNFDYNQKEINTSNNQYKELIENIINKVKEGKKVTVSIESSASRVPTSTFGSNIKLANERANVAKQIIIKSLKDKGITVDNITINAMVGGPKYIGDYQNAEKYQKFQFVKITAK